MKARPILFRPAMVRALLDGTKVQTRRIVKPAFGARHPIVNLKDDGIGDYSGRFNDPDSWGYPCAEDGNDIQLGRWLDLCPYGKPGDLLWIRENFAMLPGGVYYKASSSYAVENYTRWKPSIHMPRGVSRLTLQITDVRVQRLQDISQKDALAEGVTKRGGFYCMDWSPLGKPTGIKNYTTGADHLATESYLGNDNARGAFASYFEKINGPTAWEENPWVWVIEFKVHQCNIDEILRRKVA